MIRKTLFQCAAILTLSAVLAVGATAIRPDAIPWVHAQGGAVDLSGSGETIELKDAVLLHASGRALFLDARSRLEYGYGHVKGALSLPPDDFETLFPVLEPKLRGAEALISYCEGERCPLSHELAALLRTAGLENVRVLVDGWTLWNREGFATETGGANLHSLFPPPANLCTDCGQ